LLSTYAILDDLIPPENGVSWNDLNMMSKIMMNLGVKPQIKIKITKSTIDPKGSGSGNTKRSARAAPVFYTFSSFVYAKVCDMILRNQGQALVAIFIRIYAALGGTTTKGLVSDLKITLANFSKIAASQGIRGLVLYLKVCYVCLQQNITGHIGDSPNEPRVSRTRSGIPRVFPTSFRRKIQSHSAIFVRFALTMLSIYRDLSFKGKLKLSTITNPSTAKSGTLSMMIGLIPRFHKLFVAPVQPKGGFRAWLKGRFSYFPISTSSPSSSGIWPGSHPTNLLRAARSLTDKQVNDLATLNKLTVSDGIIHPNEMIGRVRTDPDYVGTEMVWVSKGIPTGKLGLKLEAAGKVRVFAMIDPWSQWCLYPFHKGIFRIISRYPDIDGTFNQLKPLKRAWAHMTNKSYGLFSMDLSAATDRLPIALQIPLISSVFGFDMVEAKAWADILVNREYVLPQSAAKFSDGAVPAAVTYNCGQPMGGYSSWPMLAITHHFIVQVAAWTSGVTPKDKIFKGYAVLGDDIVIYDKIVASAYHSLILSLGVECNLSKSIISPKGLGMEFAKRIFLKGGIDISPAPLKEFYSAMGSVNALIEYGRKYKLTTTSLVKVAGFGYKVIASCNKPFHKITNLKVRYLIFNDFITNPKLVTAALRSRALGISSSQFSHYILDYAKAFALDLIKRYELILTNHNLIFGGMFNRITKSTILDQLFDLWAIPYHKRMFERYLMGHTHLKDCLSYEYRDATGFLFARARWENLWKILKTDDDRINYAVKAIQAWIKIDKDMIFDEKGLKPELIIPNHLKVPKRPGFPGLHRLQLAWTKFFNLRRKLFPPYGPVFIPTAEGNTREMKMGSFMIPISIVVSMLKSVVASLFFKRLAKPPILPRIFPFITRKITSAKWSIGYRSIAWLLCGEMMISSIIFLVMTVLALIYFKGETEAWALFWPIWLTFSKTAISSLESMKGFFNGWSLYYSSTPVPYGTFSFLTVRYIIFMSSLSTWFVGQTDAMLNCIDAVTLAYNDGFIACLGALTGRIYFWWVKPFLGYLMFPITYAGGWRFNFNYEVVQVIHNIWIEAWKCFDLLFYGLPLDPWIFTDFTLISDSLEATSPVASSSDIEDDTSSV